MLIELDHCTIEFSDWGALTRFPDGAEIPAVPHNTPHYHVISHRCGYQDDILRYCHEHEFAHSFIAQELKDAPSHVLWQLAHGQKVDKGEAVFEEISAQTFQRWLRAAEEPIVSMVNWYGLKAKALGLLDNSK